MCVVASNGNLTPDAFLGAQASIRRGFSGARYKMKTEGGKKLGQSVVSLNGLM